jgi:putative transposase
MVKPSQRREMAEVAHKIRGVSIKLACKAFCLSESCYYYQPKLDNENALIADWLVKLTSNWLTWGFGLCFLYLRNVQGFKWNHKRVYRIYKDLELNLRIKPKKRIIREKPDKLKIPSSLNEVWSMDFMHDQLSDQRSYRLLNIIDDCNREGLAMEVDISLPSERVIRTLDQVIEWRGKPKEIRCDNGPEYISAKLQRWAEEKRIKFIYIQPGNPQQNAYIERFNRTVRYDWLNQDIFKSLEEVQDKSTRWLWHYNHERPNMALGGVTPYQKRMMLNQRNHSTKIYS